MRAIEFPTGAYHEMPPKELAEHSGQHDRCCAGEGLEQVGELVSVDLPGGTTIADLLKGSADPNAVMPEVPGMPSVARSMWIADGVGRRRSGQCSNPCSH